MISIGTPLLWGGFLAGVVVLLVLDMTVFHNEDKKDSFGIAVGWVCFWVGLAIAFGLFIYLHFGRDPALEYLAGYLIEESLSVDNLFVFLLIFSFFGVPAKYQHRVLFWGILGAVILRGLFIFLGTALISRFHWTIYIFGAFLLYTGIKLLSQRDIEVHPEDNPVVHFFRRLMPITSSYHGHQFFVRLEGKLHATPLMLVLVMVEATDVVFAVDSIPAVFGVTRDPFIAFTSNIMAVLGLRALYFVLAGMMERFRHLNVGLGLVLAFVGVKMLIEDIFHIPIGWSLGVVAALIGGSVLYSWLVPEEEAGEEAAATDEATEEAGDLRDPGPPDH